MKISVKYLDSKILKSDIDNYNNWVSVITHPKDRGFDYYFSISREIEFDSYSVMVDDIKTSIIGITSSIFIINVCGEILFVDVFGMKSVWSQNFKTSRSFKENIDEVIRLLVNGTHKEFFYSWDSIIERIKILKLEQIEIVGGMGKSSEFLNIDKQFKRESNINKILENEI